MGTGERIESPRRRRRRRSRGAPRRREPLCARAGDAADPAEKQIAASGPARRSARSVTTRDSSSSTRARARRGLGRALGVGTEAIAETGAAARTRLDAGSRRRLRGRRRRRRRRRRRGRRGTRRRERELDLDVVLAPRAGGHAHGVALGHPDIRGARSGSAAGRGDARRAARRRCAIPARARRARTGVGRKAETARDFSTRTRDVLGHALRCSSPCAYSRRADARLREVLRRRGWRAGRWARDQVLGGCRDTFHDVRASTAMPVEGRARPGVQARRRASSDAGGAPRGTMIAAK